MTDRPNWQTLRVVIAFILAPLAALVVACLRFFIAVSDSGRGAEYATIVLFVGLIAYASTLVVAVPAFALVGYFRERRRLPIFFFAAGGLVTGAAIAILASPGFQIRMVPLLIGAVGGALTALLFQLIAIPRKPVVST